MVTGECSCRMAKLISLRRQKEDLLSGPSVSAVSHCGASESGRKGGNAALSSLLNNRQQRLGRRRTTQKPVQHATVLQLN